MSKIITTTNTCWDTAIYLMCDCGCEMIGFVDNECKSFFIQYYGDNSNGDNTGFDIGNKQQFFDLCQSFYKVYKKATDKVIIINDEGEILVVRRDPMFADYFININKYDSNNNYQMNHCTWEINVRNDTMEKFLEALEEKEREVGSVL